MCKRSCDEEAFRYNCIVSTCVCCERVCAENTVLPHILCRESAVLKRTSQTLARPREDADPYLYVHMSTHGRACVTLHKSIHREKNPIEEIFLRVIKPFKIYLSFSQTLGKMVLKKESL